MSRPTVVIVDAFSTGRLLAAAWHETHDILHVRSTQELPAAFANSAPAALFERDFTADVGFSSLCTALRQRRPAAVVCGSEFGVEYADRLAQALGLPGNDPASSAARRDKHRMAARLAAVGIPATIGYRCADADAAEQAYRRLGGRDAVVKPTDSAGSDDVYFCASAAEVCARTSSILGRTNLMQKRNAHVLVQERLTGTEYVVNSVSADGRHFVTDVWRCHKRVVDGRPVYDYEALVTPDDPALDVIYPYIRTALTGLDVVWGPAHSELIVTAHGPRLLETGARISGLANPHALDLCTGRNQVALSKQVYLDPEAVGRLTGSRYALGRHALCVNLIAPDDGQLDADHLQRRLDSLLSFESLRLRTEGRVNKTIDLNSSPGVVFLVHPEPAQLAADYQALREIERTTYRPAPRTALAGGHG